MRIDLMPSPRGEGGAERRMRCKNSLDTRVPSCAKHISYAQRISYAEDIFHPFRRNGFHCESLSFRNGFRLVRATRLSSHVTQPSPGRLLPNSSLALLAEFGVRFKPCRHPHRKPLGASAGRPEDFWCGRQDLNLHAEALAPKTNVSAIPPRPHIARKVVLLYRRFSL